MLGVVLFALGYCAYLQSTCLALKTELKHHKNYVEKHIASLEADIQALQKGYKVNGDAAADMQRLLPPMREALQAFSKFNKTY